MFQVSSDRVPRVVCLQTSAKVRGQTFFCPDVRSAVDADLVPRPLGVFPVGAGNT